MEFFDSRKRRGLLRSLVIRTSLHRECMVVVVLARRDPAAERAITSLMRSEFPNVTSLFAAYTGTGRGAVDWEDLILLSGSPVIRERCGTLNLQIHPKSFYQTNPLQAERLYSMVREWAHLTGTETVFDLYCGIGSISLYLAKDAGHVYGVESLPEAVRNATENARANGIENCSFRSGRAEQVVTEDFLERYGRADLVIVDPPRGGLVPAVVRALKGAAPKRIIYVSCNPATQARDVAALSETHALVRLRPVDMFPHTHHIECVAELAGR
jgi:23S rRNA (uracil1939-C5)-methyltransferase